MRAGYRDPSYCSPMHSAAPTTPTSYLRVLYVGAFFALLALGVRATFGLFMQPMGLEQGWGAMYSRWRLPSRTWCGESAVSAWAFLPTAMALAVRLRWAPPCMRWACWVCASLPTKFRYT